MDVLDKIDKAIPEQTVDSRDVKIEQLANTVKGLEDLIKSLVQPKEQEPLEPEVKTIKSIKDKALKVKEEREQAKNKEELLITNMNEHHLLIDSLKQLSEKDEQDYLFLIKERYPDLEKEDVANQNKIFKISIIQLDSEVDDEMLEILDKSDDITIDNQFKISYKKILNQKGDALKEGAAFSKKLIDKGLDIDKLEDALRSGDELAIKEAREIIEKNNLKQVVLKEVLKYK